MPHLRLIPILAMLLLLTACGTVSASEGGKSAASGSTPTGSAAAEGMPEAFYEGPQIDYDSYPDPSEHLEQMREAETVSMAEKTRGATWDFSGTVVQLPDNAWVQGAYATTSSSGWILKDTKGNSVSVNGEGLVVHVAGDNFMEGLLPAHQDVTFSERSAVSAWKWFAAAGGIGSLLVLGTMLYVRPRQLG